MLFNDEVHTYDEVCQWSPFILLYLYAVLNELGISLSSQA